MRFFNTPDRWVAKDLKELNRDGGRAEFLAGVSLSNVLNSINEEQ